VPNPDIYRCRYCGVEGHQACCTAARDEQERLRGLFLRPSKTDAIRDLDFQAALDETNEQYGGMLRRLGQS
jgi:hypothetical protein